MPVDSQTYERPPAYPQVVPNIADWPITQLSKNRHQVVSQVIEESVQVLVKGKGEEQIVRLVADAYFQEQSRMKETPWKVDPRDEKAFFKRIKGKLQALSVDGKAPGFTAVDVLTELVERYAMEIAGDFRVPTYKFARKAINWGFSRLFNVASEGLFRGFWHQRKQLVDKMHLTGATEQVRQLAAHGTVILVPTHFSNLDSIVLGWAIETLGLPAFTYGAGINLFGHPVLSWFMSRLGAFRVDRRKKNDVYLTVLKVYTENVLRAGGHMLFFPGGTRSRSGSIETRLKLGLLGTAFDAQRKLLESNSPNQKIFIVPLVMSYHTVLEAPNLINQQLKREGKEKFVLVKDDFRSIRKTLRYIWQFLGSTSEMVFSFGEATDLFGNPVDDEGNSLDPFGKKIDLREYFSLGGKPGDDAQRAQAYTRLLGDRILTDYYRYNLVFSSHLVAFAAFHSLLKQWNRDIYNLMRIPDDELILSSEELEKVVDRLHVRLRQLERDGKVKLAPHMKTDAKGIVEHALTNLGGYHIRRPLIQTEDGMIRTEDIKVLYFYSNRMNGYELERYI